MPEKPPRPEYPMHTLEGVNELSRFAREEAKSWKPGDIPLLDVDSDDAACVGPSDDDEEKGHHSQDGSD